MRREYPDAPIVGVGAVVWHEDRVLLVRRGREPLKGEWSLPGGALELGETLEAGTAREVLEETGIEVEVLSVVEVFDRIHREAGGDARGGVRYHFVLVDFLCRVTGGALRCGDDAEDARWVAHAELNSHGVYQIAPFTVAVIEKARRMAEQRRFESS